MSGYGLRFGAEVVQCDHRLSVPVAAVRQHGAMWLVEHLETAPAQLRALPVPADQQAHEVHQRVRGPALRGDIDVLRAASTGTLPPLPYLTTAD